MAHHFIDQKMKPLSVKKKKASKFWKRNCCNNGRLIRLLPAGRHHNLINDVHHTVAGASVHVLHLGVLYHERSWNSRNAIEWTSKCADDATRQDSWVPFQVLPVLCFWDIAKKCVLQLSRNDHDFAMEITELSKNAWSCLPAVLLILTLEPCAVLKLWPSNNPSEYTVCVRTWYSRTPVKKESQMCDDPCSGGVVHSSDERLLWNFCLSRKKLPFVIWHLTLQFSFVL